MIGQLTTSFLLGKVSPTMTSTTSNLCAEAATEERKTRPCNGLPGATLDSNRPPLSKGGGVLRILNDLLPYRFRPIKAKRRRIRKRHGLRVELYTLRMHWHSHYKYKVRQLFKIK